MEHVEHEARSCKVAGNGAGVVHAVFGPTGQKEDGAPGIGLENFAGGTKSAVARCERNGKKHTKRKRDTAKQVPAAFKGVQYSLPGKEGVPQHKIPEIFRQALAPDIQQGAYVHRGEAEGEYEGLRKRPRTGARLAVPRQNLAGEQNHGNGRKGNNKEIQDEPELAGGKPAGVPGKVGHFAKKEAVLGKV